MASKRAAKRRQAAQTKIGAGSAATGESGTTGSTRSWSGLILDELTDLPVPVIANPAGWIVERAQKAR